MRAFKATTRQLPASAVETLYATKGSTSLLLNANTPVPTPGTTLLISPGGVVPQGVALVVASVTRSSSGLTVTGRPADLSDIYQVLRVATSTSIGTSLSLSPVGQHATTSSTSPRALQVPTSAVPFSCHGSANNNRPVTVTADFSKTHIDPTIDLVTEPSS